MEKTEPQALLPLGDSVFPGPEGDQRDVAHRPGSSVTEPVNAHSPRHHPVVRRGASGLDGDPERNRQVVKPGGTEIGNGVEPHFYRDGLPFPDLDPVLPGSRPRAAATVRAPGGGGATAGSGGDAELSQPQPQKAARRSGRMRFISVLGNAKVDRARSAVFSGAPCDRSPITAVSRNSRLASGSRDRCASGTAPHRGPLRIGDRDGMDLHQVFVRLEPVHREGTEGVGERGHPEPGRFPVRGPGRQYRREAGRGPVILDHRAANVPVASGHPARGRRREIPTSSSGVIRSGLPMP